MWPHSILVKTKKLLEAKYNAKNLSFLETLTGWREREGKEEEGGCEGGREEGREDCSKTKHFTNFSKT